MADKVQKIREEVERLKGWNNNVHNSTRHMTLQEEDFNRGKHSSYLEILNFIDSLQEEPVSIDFEKELYKAFGQVKDFTLGMRIAKWFYEMGKNSQEPVSEEFEEALAQEWKGYNDRGAATVDVLEDNTQELAFAKGFYRGAKWQKEQDKETIELAEDHAMLAGMEKMKEDIMKDATEVTVHIEAGNYPYIPQIELYDYGKDIPLAKEGDKYKVVLIKGDDV